MQIRSSSLAYYRSLPGAEYRGERVAAAGVRGDADGQGGRAREVTRLFRSPVAADVDADFAGLPPQVRGALQSYLSNGPSLGERYGVELAGVDLFV